jgi:orotate phosphoribosyltransferase
MNYQEQFIEFMVRSGVLTFGDFTTKSGRKTPFFINTGNYKTGMQIAKLGEFYADCIFNHTQGNFDVLFGPAYKGIPLSVAASIALYQKYQLDKAYCFNRKEIKDHGEGGSIVGYKPKTGDKMLIIEDVITAGTSVRESIPLLKAAASVEVLGLVISVDRMERGNGKMTALQEVQEEFGIKTFAVTDIKQILHYLLNREIDGKIYIDDAMKNNIENYLALYGA